jgi:hypothetical protein
MTEEQIKTLCKIAVENSNRPLSAFQKELIKQAIDQAKTPMEMVVAILTLLSQN